MRRPLISLTLAYGMGLILGHLFPLRQPTLLFYLLSLLASLAGLGIRKWRRRAAGPHATPYPPLRLGILPLAPLLLAC
ncbi:MAG: hypothetical protein HYY20_03585, partial [Candidatus Tectomicrobia bacterium]|nr:hypothetical protein [Candidatus Tectomicrobia bacterium]